MNHTFGESLIHQMTETRVTAGHLAWAMDVSVRAVRHWRNGHEPSSDKKQEIIDFFAARLEGVYPSHPHRQFLLRLEQEVSSGNRIEIVGLPGMLKTRLLEDLDRRLNSDGAPRTHFFFRDLAAYTDIAKFWNTVGANLIGGQRSFSVAEIMEALRGKRFSILLDDADRFLANMERRFANSSEFGPMASLWIQNLVNLPGAVILTSTIPCRDFVGLVAGGSPSAIQERCLTNRRWYTVSAWNLWTASLVEKKTSRVQDLADVCARIPVVFKESLQLIEAGSNMGEAVEEMQNLIAQSIWNRLPLKTIELLKGNNFQLSPDSRLYKAFFKSGIIEKERENSLGQALRVSSWLATWRSEAKQ
jgi:hypothetical protein